jgi:hypothetical protein
MTRSYLGKFIRQGKTNEVMVYLEALLSFPPRTKMEIGSNIENYSATQLYEKFYEVLDLLGPEQEDTEDDTKKSEILLTNLKISRTLKESISTMLCESFQTEINQEIKKNPDFLRKVVPTYLESKDTRLLFERLWKILEELGKEHGFNEEQICCAWAVSLCHLNL